MIPEHDVCVANLEKQKITKEELEGGAGGR